jgi:NADH-quinone oxidoreductase subunit C
MVKEQLIEKLLQLLPEAKVAEKSQYPEITVPANQLHAFAKKLKEDETTQLDYLFCLTGVDWPEKLSVVYHLTSTKFNHIMVLKVFTKDRENPEIDSLSDIWRTAEFHEREVFDLFGIRFLNHPDLRRLFLDDEWKGYPLRKDFVDDINMIGFR